MKRDDRSQHGVPPLPGWTKEPMDRRVALLDAVPAFVFLPQTGLKTMADAMKEETYSAGTDVVREGEDGDKLFLIVEGKAHAWTGIGNRKTPLSDMKEGELFGEIALLHPDSKRHATVTAVTDLRVLTLSRDDFQDILQVYPLTRQYLSQRKRVTLLRKFLSVNVLYRLSFADPRRERMFLSSTSFLLCFAGVRAITISIRAGKGPFRNVTGPDGKHIHHLVWGIALLLLVGYLWLVQVGTGVGEKRAWMRSTAVSYGIGSALTLDEFALWLNLEDVYWAPEGRRSVDAVITFAAFLSVGLWGRPFWRALYRFLFPSRQRTISI